MFSLLFSFAVMQHCTKFSDDYLNLSCCPTQLKKANSI